MWFLFSGAFDESFLVSGQAGAFKEQRADLALELADRPVSFEAFVFVEGAFPRVVESDQFDEFAPREPEQDPGRKRCGQFRGACPRDSAGSVCRITQVGPFDQCR